MSLFIKLIISSHLTPFLLVIFILLKTYFMTRYSDLNAILLIDFGNVSLFTLFDSENQKINPLNFFMTFISNLSVCS